MNSVTELENRSQSHQFIKITNVKSNLLHHKQNFESFGMFLLVFVLD